MITASTTDMVVPTATVTKIVLKIFKMQYKYLPLLDELPSVRGAKMYAVIHCYNLAYALHVITGTNCMNKKIINRTSRFCSKTYTTVKKWLQIAVKIWLKLQPFLDCYI